MHKIIQYFNQYKVDPNTTATVVITLLTFSLGFIINETIHFIRGYIARRSYRKSYLVLLRDFRKACEKQCEHIEKSLSTSSFVTGQGFNVTHVVISSINVFERVDFNEFLQNFEPLLADKKYNKAVSKLFEIHELIKFINKTAFETQKEFFNEFKKHESIYYKNLSEIRRMVDRLNFEYNGKTVASDDGIILQTYFDIFNDWHIAGQPKDMKSTHTMLIKRMLELNKKNFRHPLILQFNDPALEADRGFQNIVEIERVIKGTFKNFVFHHKRAARLLKVIIRRLE